ncbi:MAG TPA: hypothetical protein VMC06_06515, partial [Opitutaceae bacterium]|nr:hypothetical protein [Opitutaceae bacterium]
MVEIKSNIQTTAATRKKITVRVLNEKGYVRRAEDRARSLNDLVRLVLIKAGWVEVPKPLVPVWVERAFEAYWAVSFRKIPEIPREMQAPTRIHGLI